MEQEGNLVIEVSCIQPASGCVEYRSLQPDLDQNGYDSGLSRHARRLHADALWRHRPSDVPPHAPRREPYDVHDLALGQVVRAGQADGVGILTAAHPVDRFRFTVTGDTTRVYLDMLPRVAPQRGHPGAGLQVLAAPRRRRQQLRRLLQLGVRLLAPGGLLHLGREGPALGRPALPLRLRGLHGRAGDAPGLRGRRHGADNALCRCAAGDRARPAHRRRVRGEPAVGRHLHLRHDRARPGAGRGGLHAEDPYEPEDDCAYDSLERVDGMSRTLATAGAQWTLDVSDGGFGPLDYSVRVVLEPTIAYTIGQTVSHAGSGTDSGVFTGAEHRPLRLHGHRAQQARAGLVADHPGQVRGTVYRADTGDWAASASAGSLVDLEPGSYLLDLTTSRSADADLTPIPYRMRLYPVPDPVTTTLDPDAEGTYAAEGSIGPGVAQRRYVVHLSQDTELKRTTSGQADIVLQSETDWPEDMGGRRVRLVAGDSGRSSSLLATPRDSTRSTSRSRSPHGRQPCRSTSPSGSASRRCLHGGGNPLRLGRRRPLQVHGAGGLAGPRHPHDGRDRVRSRRAETR